jgi:tetratricopeptide (TPR) repeat protein
LLRAAPLLALLAFVAELSLRPMAESDLFFRIKAGQEILAQHGLPGRNLFSFTYPDYPDVDAAWLFEVGAAVLYGRGGFPAVVVAKTAVLLAAFALAFRLCRRRGAGPAASALALAAAAFVGRERFVERPHVVSLLGAVGVLAAADLLAAAAGRRALRIGAALVAGVALWANLHAGAFVAPVLLACAAAGARLDRDRAAARRLGLAALAAVPALFATPIGFGLLRYLRLHLTLPALHPVDEFRAPSWLSDAGLYLYGAAFAAAALSLSLARRRHLAPWRQALPPLVLVALAAGSVRFGADAALVVAPLFAVAMTALAERGRARWPARLPDPVPSIAAVALLAGLAAGPHLGGRGAGGIDLDRRELPLSAIAFVDANGLRDRMYNDFETGSYLLFEPTGGYPRHRVFVDPRLPAYPPEFHRLLGRADLGRAEWSAAMERYGVETALLAYAGINVRVAWWDPERWALVFREADARVFVRRLPRYATLIAAREIPATFTFSAQEGATTVPLDAKPAASPVPDCEWQRRLGELATELDAESERDGAPSPRARAAYDRALAAPAGCLRAADEARLAAWLAGVELGAGRAAEALALCDRALAHGDRDITTLTNRAVALEGLGRARDAVTAWDAVIARAGESPLGARARARRAHLLDH